MMKVEVGKYYVIASDENPQACAIFLIISKNGNLVTDKVVASTFGYYRVGEIAETDIGWFKLHTKEYSNFKQQLKELL